MKSPLVSIVIPCFNQGIYLLEAINSVEQCNPNLYELIIVNDGSIDEYTCKLIKELEEKGYRIINQNNLGLAAARNNGIKIAKGTYILPLDADNKIRPAYLERGVDILQRNPKIGIVYGDPYFFGEKSMRREIPDFDLTKLLIGNFIDACAVFRKTMWEEVGFYDEHMPFMGYEDWDFWLRAASKGWGFHHCREILFDYRVRKDSMISDLKEKRGEILRNYIYVKHHDFYRAELKRYYQVKTHLPTCVKQLCKTALTHLKKITDRFTSKES